jgi:hypothetical protein
MSKSPEPIVLSVALALLALGAGALAYFYPPLSQITGLSDTKAKGHQSVKMKEEEIQAALADWNSPVLWKETANHQRLFDSDEYLFYPSAYPSGNYIVKVNEKSISPSGVLLSWYRANRLDLSDPNVDREDPDGDGFSNITEYKNETVGTRVKAADCDGTKSTNPNDPKDHPSYLSRLRLQKYDLKPFRIQFKGYNQVGGDYVFQLQLADMPSFNQPSMKKTGDLLGIGNYKIGAFHQIFKDEKDSATGVVVNTDESILELVQTDINKVISLKYRQIVNSPDSTANFVMLMPADVDKVIRVPVGKILTIPEITDASYKLYDVDDDGATIHDAKTDAEYHIPKLDPAEWDEVPQAPSANAGK